MERTTIASIFADPASYGDTVVSCCGWVRSVRDMKNFGFVTLNDGSCFKDLQVVMNRDQLSNYEEVAASGVGASLRVEGTVVLTPERPQPFELQATTIVIEGMSAPDYPMQKKRATREFLRTQQHLRPRTNLFRAVFRVRSVAAFAIHSFFQERGFVYVNTPIITTSDAEGAGEMFRVTTLDPLNTPLTDTGAVDWSQDFFGHPAYLTVSGQLQAEKAEAEKSVKEAQTELRLLAPKLKSMEKLAAEYSSDPEDLLPLPDRMESAKSYREKKSKPLLEKIVKVVRSVYRAYLNVCQKFELLQRKYDTEVPYLKKQLAEVKGENAELQETARDYHRLCRAYGPERVAETVAAVKQQEQAEKEQKRSQKRRHDRDAR